MGLDWRKERVHSSSNYSRGQMFAMRPASQLLSITLPCTIRIPICSIAESGKPNASVKEKKRLIGNKKEKAPKIRKRKSSSANGDVTLEMQALDLDYHELVINFLGQFAYNCKFMALSKLKSKTS